MFYWQRISSLITFIFVIYHVIYLRFGSLPVSFELLKHMFSNPFVLGFYVIGLLAATSHMANGLWNFFISWGIVVGDRAQQFVWKLCMLFFVISSALGLTALWAFIS